MTTATDRYDTISLEAREMAPPRPGRVIATVIIGLWFAIGWIIGATWYSLAFCFAAARYGFRQGARIPVQAKQAPQ